MCFDRARSLHMEVILANTDASFIRMRPALRLAFVTSAFNEEGNIEELYRRCCHVFNHLRLDFADSLNLTFSFLIADNGSTDGTRDVLKYLIEQDPSVTVLVNETNYGPEASGGNLIQQACAYDLAVFLCSDLQDPPELALSMVRTLIQSPDRDAVLAVKRCSTGGPLLQLARALYYKALGYSSRLPLVPSGFHGFGCYRKKVLQEASRYWNRTDLNVRQCLVNASYSPELIEYVQAPRLRGVSSYRKWGYWKEALAALVSGDAATSRLAFTIGTAGLLFALLVAVFLLFNFMKGNSGYGGGVPTVMALILMSFAVQMMMFSLLSRQIEGVRMGGLRRKVVFRRMGDDQHV